MEKFKSECAKCLYFLLAHAQNVYNGEGLEPRLENAIKKWDTSIYTAVKTCNIVFTHILTNGKHTQCTIKKVLID